MINLNYRLHPALKTAIRAGIGRNGVRMATHKKLTLVDKKMLL